MNMVVSKHHLSAQMVQGRTHRMTEVVARLAPELEPRADAHRGGRRLRANAGRSQGLLRSELALSRRRDPVQGSARRKGSPDAVAAHVRRRVRADHLRRERREPHAHARRATRTRARRARGARRRRDASAPAAARRESSAHTHRCARSASCFAVGGVRLLDVTRASATRRARTRFGSTSSCSASRSRCPMAVALLLSFVASLPEGGDLWLMDRGGCAPHDGRRATSTAPARARRRADRGVGRAARRRRSADAHDGATV